MPENLGTVKIIFDDQSTSGSSENTDQITELKSISGDLRKLVSGSMTGLLGGVGALGAGIGGALAVGAGYLSGQAIQRSSTADWLSENQMKGNIRQGDFNIDAINDMAKSGDVEGLAKELGTSKEKAQELVDVFKVMNTTLDDMKSKLGTTESLKKDLAESTKEGKELETVLTRIQSLIFSINHKGENMAGSTQNGITPFYNSSGSVVGYEDANKQQSIVANAKDTAQAIDRANVSSNTSCSTSRTVAPIINMLNSNSSNVSRMGGSL